MVLLTWDQVGSDESLHKKRGHLSKKLSYSARLHQDNPQLFADTKILMPLYLAFRPS